MKYEACICLLIEVDSEAEAMDCVAEALRPLLKHNAPLSSVLNWRYEDLNDLYPLTDIEANIGYDPVVEYE